MKRPSRFLSRKMFPRKTLHKHSDGVYVAASRKSLSKDLEVAVILARHGHTVYLCRRRFHAKHPDTIGDGEIMEFKYVTGSLDKMGNRFEEVLKQASNIFIYTTDKTERAIRSKLVGNNACVTRQPLY